MPEKTIRAVFDQDSKRFHRYSIADNDEGIRGSFYFRKDKPIPKELVVTLSVNKDK